MLAIGTVLISVLVFSLLNFGITYLFYGVTPSELPALLEKLDGQAVEIAKCGRYFPPSAFSSFLQLFLPGFSAMQQEFT